MLIIKLIIMQENTYSAKLMAMMMKSYYERSAGLMRG